MALALARHHSLVLRRKQVTEAPDSGAPNTKESRGVCGAKNRGRKLKIELLG